MKTIKASQLQQHDLKPDHRFVAYVKGTDLVMGMGDTRQACVASAIAEHNRVKGPQDTDIDSEDLLVLAIDWT